MREMPSRNNERNTYITTIETHGETRMTWVLENIKLIVMVGLIGPSIFCAYFAFNGEFKDKNERKAWLLSSVYGGIISALMFLWIGP